MTSILTEAALAEAVDDLSSRDSDLARVVDTYGRPALRGRPPGFATLILLIVEQQVSLASARATFDRLCAAAAPLGPDRLLALSGEELRAAGLSRQKARYCRVLAEEVAGGGLDIDGLAAHDDDAARAELVRITGIGEWTADIYLLTALGRPDIWPAGDLALAVAAQEVKGFDRRPAEAELRELGEAWRPWRAVATRILWHYYLNTKRRRQGNGTG